MIGLTDIEFAMLKDACAPEDDGVDEGEDGELDAIFSMQDRGLLSIEHLEDDVIELHATRLGSAVFQVERAIRSGVPPLLESETP